MENIPESKSLIQAAILRTVAFFDLFNYPLTAFEVYKNLGINSAFDDVLSALEYFAQGNLIEERHGFYFLKKRDELVTIRQGRYHFTDRKAKIAIRIVRILKFIPWIKMIALANMIGAHNLRDESDIDLFIVSKRDRIWLTRFFCVGLIKILNLRPTEKSGRDKICLSFFVDEDNLDLKRYLLKDGDPYFASWLAGLVPIYDDGIYHRLIVKNDWILDYFPNWQKKTVCRRRAVKKRCGLKIMDIIFSNFFEDAAYKLQKKILPTGLKSKIGGSEVVIGKGVIKTHANDRRIEYRDKWLSNSESILNS